MNPLADDHSERITRIKHKVSERNSKLNPKLIQHDVEEFEGRYQIHLPEDYRQFLTEIGNGGDGPPFYGVVPLAESIPINLDKGFRPDLPFSLTQAWVWEDEIGWSKELLSLLDEVRYHGHLYLGTNGCGEDWILIVTGKERGHVWNRAQHGVPHALSGAKRRGRARRKMGILCSGPTTARCAKRTRQFDVSFGGWRSGWRRAVDAEGVSRLA